MVSSFVMSSNAITANAITTNRYVVEAIVFSSRYVCTRMHMHENNRS